MLYRYLNILFYSFILQKRCVHVRREVIEWVWGRVGVSVSHVWRYRQPFLLPRLSSTFQPIRVEITSAIMVKYPLKQLNKTKWKSELELSNILNVQLHLWCPLEHWKVSETSSSQCLLGKKNKKGAVVGEGHDGVAYRRDYTVCLSTLRHITLHSQQPLQW